MTSIGTGYDLSASTFSPEGRVFQVEYAGKAVENSGTAIGLRVKDGVVLGVEKIIRSKMLEPGSNRRIFNVAPHCGVAVTGLMADARQIVNRGRSEARSYKNFYGSPAPPKMLNERLSSFVQMYTLSGGARPFGVATLLAGYDKRGPRLYLIEPSGVSLGYYGIATGKGKQAAKTEIEKLDLTRMTAREAVKEVARIIYMVHDEIKDKHFELEMSWICDESGRKHEYVPKDLLAEAETAAKAALEAEFNSDTEMSEDE